MFVCGTNFDLFGERERERERKRKKRGKERGTKLIARSGLREGEGT